MSKKILTLKEKYNLVNEPDNIRPFDLAVKYGISIKTIYRLIKSKEDINQDYLSNTVNHNVRRCKSSKYPDLEEELFKWYQTMTVQNETITCSHLKKQANLLSTQLGYYNFECHDSWISRFRLRKRITIKPGKPDEELLDENWKENLFQPLTNQYAPKDIFWTQETSLLYRLLPTGTTSFMNITCDKGEFADERLTIVFGCNVTGSEKLPLLVVGNRENKKYHDKFDQTRLLYTKDAKSWVTKLSFFKWLKLIDDELFALNPQRKIALLTKNKFCHQMANELKTIKLFYYPPSIKFDLTPFKTVIEAFKGHYRALVLSSIMKQGLENVCTHLTESLDMIKDCWWFIHPSLITKCFRSYGFENCELICVKMEKTNQSDLLMVFKQLEQRENGFNCSLQEFLNVDYNLAIREEGNENMRGNLELVCKTAQHFKPAYNFLNYLTEFLSKFEEDEETNKALGIVRSKLDKEQMKIIVNDKNPKLIIPKLPTTEAHSSVSKPPRKEKTRIARSKLSKIFEDDNSSDEFEGFNKEDVLRKKLNRRKAKVNRMISHMRDNAKMDKFLSSTIGKNKVGQLTELNKFLNNKDDHDAFFEHSRATEVLSVWLEILPDNILPHLAIRQVLLKYIYEIRDRKLPNLEDSDLIDALLKLMNSESEVFENKQLIRAILTSWRENYPDDVPEVIKVEQPEMDLDVEPMESIPNEPKRKRKQRFIDDNMISKKRCV